MDDPVEEITPIIHALTEGTPSEQQAAINTYFTSDASFTHPFCRTGSFEGSRMLIHGIFRWYKIMDPKLELEVNGIAYDSLNLTLYVNISQTFAIWFIPFHRSPVTLTTQLQLRYNEKTQKYLIASQNDLYQVDQFFQFFAPWGIGTTVVYLWHFWATFFCVILAFIFTPFTWLEQSYYDGTAGPIAKSFMGAIVGLEERRMRKQAKILMAEQLHEVVTGNQAAKIKRQTRTSQVGVKQFDNMQVVDTTTPTS